MCVYSQTCFTLENGVPLLKLSAESLSGPSQISLMNGQLHLRVLLPPFVVTEPPGPLWLETSLSILGEVVDFSLD